MRNPWIIGQLVAAAVLLALSLLGVIGTVVFNMPELAFSFQGGIQAFAVFPGLVISLIVNALIMRLHREMGVSTVEKVLLIIEGVVILLLIGYHFYTDDNGYTFLLAFLAWPIVILLGTAIAIVAGVRNGNRPPTAPPVAGAPV